MPASNRGRNGRFTAGNRARADAAAARRDERDARRQEKLYARQARELPPTPPAGSRYVPYEYGDYVFDHPGYGLVPALLVSILYAAEQGDLARQCRLIDDLVEGDGTLRNLLEQRRGAVASKPREVQAAAADPGSVLAARVLAHALSLLPMREVLDHLLTFNQYGYAAVEITWGLVEFD